MRSKWKCPFAEFTGKFIRSRRSTILPLHVIGNRTYYHIHNGKTFIRRGPITDKYIGYKFGQLAITRKIKTRTSL